MTWIAGIDLSIVIVFTLTLARVSGVVIAAPVFGGQELPMRFRALLAFTVAILIVPSRLDAANTTEPSTIVMYAVAIAGELLIGLSLGMGVQLFFAGIQMAGEMIGRIGGLMLADVFDPTMGTSVPLFSRFLHLVTTAVFVTIGGHRVVMASLLDTFETFPLGYCRPPTSAGEAMIELAATSFELGFRVSAPAVTALLLATVILSIVGRTLPQLNIMAVGFSLNAVLTFAMIFVGLGTITWVFQEQFAPSLDILLQSLHTPLRDEWLSQPQAAVP